MMSPLSEKEKGQKSIRENGKAKEDNWQVEEQTSVASKEKEAKEEATT